MNKAINSHNGWKAKDISLILLTKPAKQKRSIKNWQWQHSAKEAAELLGRSVSSIKNQRIIYYADREVL
ncbi:MAG TPA: hypothetical protein EYN54_02665 [Methylococcaceae bacterium]|nr:hypothetical protein [Methylococcaceae bacterium]